MLAETAPRPATAARRAAAFPDPTSRGGTIRAVLFDVDGTLYAQSRMRLAMVRELGLFTVTHPIAAATAIPVLRSYRRAQETMRQRVGVPVSRRTQIEIAASATGVAPGTVERIANEWMFERPLKRLAPCRAEGLVPLLDWMRGLSMPLGVLSDYPAHAKLDALGIAGYFDLVLSATDPDVAAFKPSPAGLNRACTRWGVEPADVLYIGDRLDVDAEAAAAAGMPCALITTRPVPDRPALVGFPSFMRLHRVLDDNSR